MLNQWRGTGIALMAGACLLALLPASGMAQKKKAADKTAEEQMGDDVTDVITAYRLAEFGRKNDAPEALITAAVLFRRLAKVSIATIEEKPTIEVEKDSKDAPLDKVVAAPDYGKEASDLFDEALALGARLKWNLDPLINQVNAREKAREKAREEAPEGTRDPVGGAKQMSRAIGGGQTQAFHFKLFANRPTNFGFRASRPMRVTVVQSNNDAVWVDTFVAFGNATWYPGGHHHHPIPPKVGKKGGTKGGKGGQDVVPITIRISNLGQAPAQFQFLLN